VKGFTKILIILFLSTVIFAAKDSTVQNLDTSKSISNLTSGITLIANTDSTTLLKVCFWLNNGQAITLFGKILLKNETAKQYILLMPDGIAMSIIEATQIVGMTYYQFSIESLRKQIQKMQDREDGKSDN
jgi:hypothetical protein